MRAKDHSNTTAFLDYAVINLSEEDMGKLTEALEILSGFVVATKKADEHILNLSIDFLNLSVGAYNCLQANHFLKIKDVIKNLNESPSQLLKFKNLGRKRYCEIVRSLVKHKELKKYLAYSKLEWFFEFERTHKSTYKRL